MILYSCTGTRFRMCHSVYCGNLRLQGTLLFPRQSNHVQVWKCLRCFAHCCIKYLTNNLRTEEFIHHHHKVGHSLRQLFTLHPVRNQKKMNLVIKLLLWSPGPSCRMVPSNLGYDFLSWLTQSRDSTTDIPRGLPPVCLHILSHLLSILITTRHVRPPQEAQGWWIYPVLCQAVFLMLKTEHESKL